MLKYRGPGFLPGVPARDMKDDEVKKYNYHRLIASGLYYDPKPQAESRPADEADGKPARRRTKSRTLAAEE